jgi:hypothetical protein
MPGLAFVLIVGIIGGNAQPPALVEAFPDSLPLSGQPLDRVPRLSRSSPRRARADGRHLRLP